MNFLAAMSACTISNAECFTVSGLGVNVLLHTLLCLEELALVSEEKS